MTNPGPATPPSRRPLLLANAVLIDPVAETEAPGSVLVMDGRIAALGRGDHADGMPDGALTIDCRGAFLAPGIVDMRVSVAETRHHASHPNAESIASAAAAAIRGGITSMALLPDGHPPIDTPAMAEAVIAWGRQNGQVHLYPYGTLTLGAEGAAMSEMGLMAEAGAVAFTDGARAIGDALLMRRLLSYASMRNLLVVQHPEEPRLAAGGHATEGELATRLGLAPVPSIAEAMMIERDLRLLDLTGGRYHVAHVSTRAALDVLRAAKRRGLSVTCDTAPPYFLLNENAIGAYDTKARLSPPLRHEDDRLAVIEGLRDGTIDAIASDHRPVDADMKALSFAESAPGASGLETLLPTSLCLVHDGTLSLAQLFARLSAGPARLLGLPGGRLEVGGPADLILFDAGAPSRIRGETFHSRAGSTPFEGMPVQGRCLRTFLEGTPVYQADR